MQSLFSPPNVIYLKLKSPNEENELKYFWEKQVQAVMGRYLFIYFFDQPYEPSTVRPGDVVVLSRETVEKGQQCVCQTPIAASMNKEVTWNQRRTLTQITLPTFGQE